MEGRFPHVHGRAKHWISKQVDRSRFESLPVPLLSISRGRLESLSWPFLSRAPEVSTSSTSLHGFLAALLLCSACKRTLDVTLLKAVDIVVCRGNFLQKSVSYCKIDSRFS